MRVPKIMYAYRFNACVFLKSVIFILHGSVTQRLDTSVQIL
nr:MAG TPA: hypothetical protein [Caudoviricetes sp.]